MDNKYNEGLGNLKKTRGQLCAILVSTFFIIGMVDSNVVQAKENIQSRYNPTMREYEYVKKSTQKYNKIEWTHNATNYTSGVDYVEHSVSRTKSTRLNSSVSATVDGVIYQAGVGFEVGIGQSKKTTTKCTFAIPYGRYRLEYGSRSVRTRGIQNRWIHGKIFNSKNIYGNWTYGSYSKHRRI